MQKNSNIQNEKSQTTNKETNKVSLWSLKPFLDMLSPYADSLLMGGILTITTLLAGIGLLSLSGGFLTATAIAGLSVVTALEYNFFLPAAGVRFFAILRTVSRWGERVLNHNATFKLLAVFRSWLFTGLAPLSSGQLAKYHGGTLLNRITKDIDSLDNLYVRLLLPVSTAFILMLTISALLIYLDYSLIIPTGILFITAFIIMPITAWNLGKDYAPEQTLFRRKLRVDLLELVDGLESLSLNSKAWELKREQAMQTSEKLLETNWRLHKRGTFMHNSISILVAFMSILTLVLLSDSELTGVWIAALTLLFLALGEMLIPLPDAWLKLPGTAKSAQDLYELQKQESDIKFRKEACCQRFDSSISIKNLSFSYDGQSNVLENINLEIGSASHCLIQGASGGGKSTLVGLLTKQIPMQSGEIKYGELSLDNFTESEFRTQVAIAPQDSYLFKETLATNLRIAKADASDAELWQVLELVGLKQQVEAFSDKLETWIDEAGASLSGGQKRRLGIARALLVEDAELFILDEPTEGLDLESERLLIEKLTNHLKGKTLIWISHRSTNKQFFSRRILISDGKIV